MFEFLKKLFSRKKQNKKLGLCLGSGGAKGMAHIGVLRAFEEEGIAFDVVSGCSIGSIVGGLYAGGASTAAMHSFLEQSGVCNPQKLILYKLQGMTTRKMLDNMTGGSDIQDLKIPFGAVAVDIDSGSEAWFTEGSLSSAMCASSAVPPVFRAVTIDGKRYMDGAFLNSVPCDLAKKLGATFVIGVNLAREKPDNTAIKRILDEIYRENKVPFTNRSLKGYENCDVMIEPDLSAYNSMDFKRLGEMEDIGYLAAKNMMPQIKEKLKRAGLLK